MQYNKYTIKFNMNYNMQIGILSMHDSIYFINYKHTDIQIYKHTYIHYIKIYKHKHYSMNSLQGTYAVLNSSSEQLK